MSRTVPFAFQVAAGSRPQRSHSHNCFEWSGRQFLRDGVGRGYATPRPCIRVCNYDVAVARYSWAALGRGKLVVSTLYCSLFFWALNLPGASYIRTCLLERLTTATVKSDRRLVFQTYVLLTSIVRHSAVFVCCLLCVLGWCWDTGEARVALPTADRALRLLGRARLRGLPRGTVMTLAGLFTTRVGDTVAVSPPRALFRAILLDE